MAPLVTPANLLTLLDVIATDRVSVKAGPQTIIHPGARPMGHTVEDNGSVN